MAYSNALVIKVNKCLGKNWEVSPETPTMSLACDPRLNWRTCSDEWKDQLSTFYYAGVTVYEIQLPNDCANSVHLVSQGWPGQPDFLLIPQIIGSAAFVAYSFGLAISGGYISSTAAEILWSLPLAIDAYSHVALTILLRMIQNASPHDLLESKKLYSKAMLYGALLGMFCIAGVGAGAALIAVHPQYGRYSILLSVIPSAVVNIVFLVLMSLSLLEAKRTTGRLPKKAKESIFFCLVYKTLWLPAFIAFCASYTQILSISSLGGWLALMTWLLLFSQLSMTEICATVAKEQFTLKGMQRLRPKVVITMGGMTSEGATIDATDTYKSSSEEECAGGVCKPIHKVDIKIAKEMAAPVWSNPPKSWNELFSFPHPINEWEARVHGLVSGMVGEVILILAAVRPDVQAWYLYAWLIYGFLSRFLFGPKFDPQAWLVVLVIVPHLKLDPVFVPGPPKRFAQFCGLMASVISFILYMIPVRVAALWVLAMLVVLTIVQSVHGICVGCFMWHMMVVMGLLSEEMEARSTAEFKVRSPTDSITGMSRTRTIEPISIRLQTIKDASSSV
ncbi:glutaredoxin/malate transporter fusion protein [Planoprotostelium fungivorum]|uniref:Glutaredoxin/malate transporter fusion protein n=1 Tax=Planoprotostelium fungivorum TaxID=1890364 RepID=A0A2P6NGJ8_9EUKA|nr:glutaredoxin/malate transporter fusion protein [Planoprotostelium fungivorum]